MEFNTCAIAPDFKPASEKLRASLLHHFDVLPENPEELRGLTLDELQQPLTRDFARCFASIHPVSGDVVDMIFEAALIRSSCAF